MLQDVSEVGISFNRAANMVPHQYKCSSVHTLLPTLRSNGLTCTSNELHSNQHYVSLA